MSNNNTVILNVEQIFESKYVVPLYQRNFAWGEEQITRLLHDIRESMESGDQQYYIGSLVVIQRRNGEYEVIDGQQRLTTLALLSYVLQFNLRTEIHYDSRPEVESFLLSIAAGQQILTRDSSVSHFFNAIDILKDGINTMLSLSTDEKFKEKFAEYVRDHVCIVRESMPQDTDVASYFEIMNNRGEQLQEHEIIKGLLLEKLKDNPKLSQVCSIIWDACSQMNERLQKSFEKPIRTALFGDSYDTLLLNDSNFKNVLENVPTGTAITDGISLERILKDDFSFTQVSVASSDNEDLPEVNKEESIIDFPNFLMHVMRLYYNDIAVNIDSNNDIRLHDKYLLKTFRSIAERIDATEFFYRLLRCRTIFDRFIVKANFVSENDEEGREWSLLKPKYYEYASNGKKKTQLKFNNSFDSDQDMIVKALSCIQVSHPSRYYKNYLQTILSWFKSGDIEISGEEYLKKLNEYIYNDLNRTDSKAYFGLKEYTPHLQGVQISHAVLDYIDYLLWNMHVNNIPVSNSGLESNYLKDIKDFRFQYWNSVEHHYPQKRKEEMSAEDVTDFDLNCLGNVFLVGKSTNSRMSDKNPTDKASLYGENVNLAPNRQIIYKRTLKDGWSKQQIEEHFQFIESIFNSSELILSL